MKNEKQSLGYSETIAAVTRDFRRQVNALEEFSRALYAIPEVIDNSPQDPFQPLPWLMGERVWPSTRELSMGDLFIKYGQVWRIGTRVLLADEEVTVSVEREHGLSDTYEIEIWPEEPRDDYRGSVYGVYKLEPHETTRSIPVEEFEVKDSDLETDDDFLDGSVAVEENNGELSITQIGTLGLVLKSMRKKLEDRVTSLKP